MHLKLLGWLGVLTLLVCLTACGSPPPTATPLTAPSATSLAASPTQNESTATSALPSSSPTPEPPLAAMVNGQPIYLADYERRLGQYEAALAAQGIDPGSPEGQEKLAQRREWILNVMIEQVLTEQAAEAAGVVVTDEEVDAYLQDIIAEVGGEEAFEAMLAEWGQTKEEAREELRAELIGGEMAQSITEAVPETAEHVRARHILVDTMEKANHILAQLQASADFAALAQAHSLDTSTSDNGGDLGFFPRGVLVAPEVEQAAFDLQPGQFSGVITSVLGYHIVQVVERDPARPLSEENRNILKEQALEEWVEQLWLNADIQRFVETES